MYEGLKPELEEVVGRLHVGDGVVIEHRLGYNVDRTIGYVRSVNPSNLTLTKTRESNIFLETFFGHFLGNYKQPYYSFENIRVVDPVRKE